MGMDWTDIVMVVRQRQGRDSVLKQQMIDIRDKANGDWVVPLVDVKGGTSMPSPTAAFIADAIDHTAMRAASQKPMIHAPALDDAKATGIRSREMARQRRHAWYACWHRSKLQIGLRRAYRHLAAYGIASAVVCPDYETGSARINFRDPLTTYPAEFSPEDLYGPADVAWVYGVHPKSMVKRWPETRVLLERNRASIDDGLWDFIEWMDGDNIVLGVLGPRYTNGVSLDPGQVWQQSMELRRVPNRAGVVTAVAPVRVTLDRVAGQVAAVTGLVEILSRMTALDIIATEKSIFPDRYLVGRENAKPQLVTGAWQDGRTGNMNMLANVDKIGELTSTVGPNTQPMIDRIERAIRLSSGHVPAFGGETFGSLRTGQGIDRMGAFAVDPRIQELHELAEEALTCLGRGVAAVEKGWFSGTKIVAFSGWGASRGTVEYYPEKLWETDLHSVEYPMPGSDAPGAETRVISAATAGLMSRSTAMTKHPLIDDPESERLQLYLDRTDDAVFTGFVQQAASGAIPLVDAVRVKQLLIETGDIGKAIEQAQREAQERQAAQPQAPPGTAAPETQPGLAMPGQGIEGQPAPPPPGPPAPAADRMRAALAAMAQGGGGQAA